jgi:hypothetical protein
VSAAADIRRGGGRPTSLTPMVADVIVARVAVGDTFDAAARAAGVGPARSAHGGAVRGRRRMRTARTSSWSCGFGPLNSQPRRRWSRPASRGRCTHGALRRSSRALGVGRAAFARRGVGRLLRPLHSRNDLAASLLRPVLHRARKPLRPTWPAARPIRPAAGSPSKRGTSASPASSSECAS